MRMDISGPLPKTRLGSQFVIVMMDRCTKLTKAIATTNTNAATVPRIFLEP